MTAIEHPTDREAAKAHVALWIEEERNGYATQKWERDNEALQGENVQNGEWINFPFSYLNRCRMGLEHLAARQALGKVITSSTSLLERAVMLYGPMPKPAVSSTDGALPWEIEPEPDEGGSIEQGETFTEEQILGMIANAIGYEIFAKEGDAVVTISDEESERVMAAAVQVRCVMHKIETGEALDEDLPEHYVYLDEINPADRDGYNAVSVETRSGRVLAIRKGAPQSSTPQALAEIANPKDGEDPRVSRDEFYSRLSAVLGTDVSDHIARRYWNDPLIYNLINSLYQVSPEAVARAFMEIPDIDPADVSVTGIPSLPGHPGKHGETRTGLQPPG